MSPSCEARPWRFCLDSRTDKTQELLLEGIRKPKQALVPVDHALRLLSSDIHADVLDVARSLANDQQSRKNKPVFLQALRILASDPASVGRLEEVLANDSHSIDARRLAATALNHLSPESLNPRTARSAIGPRPAPSATTPFPHTSRLSRASGDEVRLPFHAVARAALPRLRLSIGARPSRYARRPTSFASSRSAVETVLIRRPFSRCSTSVTRSTAAWARQW